MGLSPESPQKLKIRMEGAPSVQAARRRGTIALDKRSAKSFIRINERIRAREMRVIDENGEQMGILPPFEALKIARERGLDLVEVSPSAIPPVCRIQDYGRFLYEKDKSESAARKKQKVIVVKEVKFSVTVDEHDYQTKKNQAVRFLTKATRSRPACVSAAARWPTASLGYAKINRLIQDIGDNGSGRVHAAHGRHYPARDHRAFEEGRACQAQNCQSFSTKLPCGEWAK
jgi:translation initiation factor IF-3